MGLQLTSARRVALTLWPTIGERLRGAVALGSQGGPSHVLQAALGCPLGCGLAVQALGRASAQGARGRVDPMSRRKSSQ